MWDEQRVDDLKRWVADGWSAAKIAETIGTTRNSVIGKVHRMGLRLDVPGKPKEAVERKPRAPRGPGERKPGLPQLRFGAGPVSPVPVLPGRPAVPFETPTAERKQLLDLEHGDCRYPFGDRAPYAFCGRKVAEGMVYCPDHAATCYQPKNSPPIAESGPQAAIPGPAGMEVAEP